MRRLVNITILFITLILTIFGSSGVSIAKCACSGKTTFLSLGKDNCCPQERDCITVSSVHLSASILPDHTDVPDQPLFVIETTSNTPVLFTVDATGNENRRAPVYSPPRLQLTTVLRV